MERRNLCLLNSSGITNWRGKWCLSSLEVRGQRNCLKEKGNTEAHVIQINRALHVTPREKKGLKKKRHQGDAVLVSTTPAHGWKCPQEAFSIQTSSPRPRPSLAHSEFLSCGRTSLRCVLARGASQERRHRASTATQRAQKKFAAVCKNLVYTYRLLFGVASNTRWSSSCTKILLVL